MALSKEAAVGTYGPRTMRVADSIQGHDIVILVDSGSSYTFLSSNIADHLVGVETLKISSQVQVANGGLLQCQQVSLKLIGTWMGSNFSPHCGSFHCSTMI